MKEQVVKINEDILEKIKDNSKDDSIIEEMLKELIIEESFHETSWQWREEYDKRVSNYLKRWNI
jgi:hypothetical protein